MSKKNFVVFVHKFVWNFRCILLKCMSKQWNKNVHQNHLQMFKKNFVVFVHKFVWNFSCILLKCIFKQWNKNVRMNITYTFLCHAIFSFKLFILHLHTILKSNLHIFIEQLLFFTSKKIILIQLKCEWKNKVSNFHISSPSNNFKSTLIQYFHIVPAFTYTHSIQVPNSIKKRNMEYKLVTKNCDKNAYSAFFLSSDK